MNEAQHKEIRFCSFPPSEIASAMYHMRQLVEARIQFAVSFDGDGNAEVCNPLQPVKAAPQPDPPRMVAVA